LQLNKEIYVTDEAKIAFVLSFLNEKEGANWKEAYLQSILEEVKNDKQETIDEVYKYPTYHKFLESFVGYFQPVTQTRAANHQLATMKQGKRSVEEFVAEFQLLVSMAGMTVASKSDHMHLINYFQRALNPAIAKKIALSENVPDTIDGWAAKAIQYDTNYRLTMAMYGRQAYSSSSGEHWGKASSSSRQKDPYAMDIDAMTMEERTSLMRRGLCFFCKLAGHLARDCPKKKGKGPPPKKDVKGIHALLSELTKEEKEELLALQTAGSTETKDF
jgi:hypothetical protein